MKNETFINTSSLRQSWESPARGETTVAQYIKETIRNELERITENMFMFEDPAHAFKNVMELKGANQSADRTAEILLTTVLNRQNASHQKIATYIVACLNASATYRGVLQLAERNGASRLIVDAIKDWGQDNPKLAASPVDKLEAETLPAVAATHELLPHTDNALEQRMA